MNIILLGAPASGKGTQADLLTREFGLYHLQTGQIARDLAKKDERIKQIIESGKLIPEEEMTMHVIDHLSNKKNNMKDILFEGFPRFISQYEALKNYLETKGDDIDKVFTLDISEDEAIKRISSRRICEKCGEVYNLVTNPPSGDKCKCGGKLIQRADDKKEAIKVRFRYYEQNTKKLIDYLDQKGQVEHVDAERSIEEIFADIKKRIKAIYNDKEK